MQYRKLGKTDWLVSEISLGTWQVGGGWGKPFDKGETFSGVDYKTGLEVVEELKAPFGEDPSLAEWAIKWILMHSQVNTVIPGASKIDQVLSNVKAYEHLPISPYKMDAVKDIYEKYLKKEVHGLW